jgi:hypothetical protein
LGSQRRLVLLWAWETLLPVTGPLPQISHTFAMIISFYLIPAWYKAKGSAEWFVDEYSIRIELCTSFSKDWQVLFHLHKRWRLSTPWGGALPHADVRKR